jgi:hypothetical protein
VVQDALRRVGIAVDEGAVDDLAINSKAIKAIKKTDVPGHALVGIGGSNTLALAPGKLGAFYRFVNFFADICVADAGVCNLFQGLQHDYIVDRQSQEGGMPDNAFTIFPWS